MLTSLAAARRGRGRDQRTARAYELLRAVRSRAFSHALVDNDLGGCADCGQPATKLLVGGAGQPDTNLCEPCEYRRYLAVTGGHDYANQQRARWGAGAIVGG